MLKSIIAKTDSNLAKCCRTLHSRKLKYLEEWLNKKIAKLQDKQYTFKTKLFWLFNNILDFPVCCICGKKVVGINVKTFRHGYGKNVHCSRACAQRHAAEHAKKTNLEKYGVEFSF